MKKTRPYISVIVPIYNIEGYISKCLDSLLSQSFKDFEIICVDDGSTDGSLNILKKYKNKYSEKIRIFTQKNSGPGVARNTGIKKARGEYVAFVDGDDYAGERYLETLAVEAQRTNEDIIIGGFLQVTESGKVFRKVSFRKHGEYSKYICPSPWGKLYKASFIASKKVLFPARTEGEDIIFNLHCYDESPKISFVADMYYNYTSRQNSIVHTNCAQFFDITVPDYFNILLKYKNQNQELKNYFIIRCVITEILRRGRSSDTKTFIAAKNNYFDWMKENQLLDNKYLKKRAKGEIFVIFLVIKIFFTIERLGFMRTFAIFYCPHERERERERVMPLMQNRMNCI